MAYTPATPSGFTAQQAQYLNQELQRIRQELTGLGGASSTNFVGKGYGGIFLRDEDVFPDLGAAYQKITTFDWPSLAEPFDVVQNVANSSLQFSRAGIWWVGAYVGFSHNEVNAGRFTNVRVFNEDTNQGLKPYFVSTGRNTDRSDVSFFNLVEVPDSVVGNDFILQIGNGSAYSNVVMWNLTLNAHHVSEFKG